MKDDLLAKYLSNFLFVQILFVQITSRYPNFIEKYYSNGIYKGISVFYRTALGWIPFSIGDVLYMLFAFVFIRFIYVIFRDKMTELRSYRLSVGAALSVLYFLFYFSWGMNYYRIPLAEKLELERENYSTESLNQFTLNTIEMVNQLHTTVVKNDSMPYRIPYSKQELYKMTKAGYNELSKTHKNFKYQVPSVKHTLISIPLTYMGFAGYLNPFTGEAQVNSKIPLYTYPFTISHEVAHQLGYAAENEANFIGYLACVSHKDSYIQLAGNVTALKYLLSELRKRDNALYQKAMALIHKGIQINFRESYDFWQSFENPWEPIFKKSYNVYLKANKQKSGIKSYSYMVDLLINYSNK